MLTHLLTVSEFMDLETVQGANYLRLQFGEVAIAPVGGWSSDRWDDRPLDGLPSVAPIDPNIGYAVVRTPDLPTREPSIQAAWVTALASKFARLFRVFGNQSGLWRTLDVDLDRPTTRSRGTGSQPLHLDFVNTLSPPDFVFLYCERSDPGGGGESVLASVSDIAEELKPETRKVLSRAIFSDGEARDLLGVGPDINPFPVLQADSPLALRFTGRLLDLDLGVAAKHALAELQVAISRRTRTVRLLPGDLLVIDQRCALHGRAELGAGQEHFPKDERRLLRHAFGRARGAEV